MPGVVCRADLSRPRRHRPVLGPRDPRPADHRRRQGALPRRAGRRGRGRERGRGGRGGAGDHGASTRICRSSPTCCRRSSPTPSRCTRGRCARGSSTGSAQLPPLDGNTCYRYRIDRGEVEAVFAHADQVVEGEYTFPAIYQYAMETHTVVASVDGGRDHRARLLPAPVPGARRARRAVRRAALEGARDRAVPRRRLRLEVVHQDGADHGRAGAQGGTPRAHPQRGLRVDGDLAPPRHEGAHAHGHDQRGAPARPRGRVLVRHRRLRRQRPARHGDRRRRRARPVPLRGLPRRRVLRVHEHRAVGLVPRVRRDAPAVDRRAADRRARAPLRSRSRSRCARPTCARAARRCAPEAGRSTRTSSATSRRPPARSAGASRRARTSAAASRSGCLPPAPIRSRRRSCGWRPTAR